MDVDGAAGEPLAERGREHLHVAGEHDEIDAFVLDDIGEPVLLRILRVARKGR